jgi:hypothetical protein
MVEVLIEEMFGSDLSRPTDYERAVVVDARTERRHTLFGVNGAGKIGMECVIETKARMILQFVSGLRGDLHVTFEEGTSAAWLCDLLKPHVTKLAVCDSRKNSSMKEGNQSDKIDARRLVELLRLNHLHPVYHGEHGLRSLKELV